jgi:hypothetical protein
MVKGGSSTEYAEEVVVGRVQRKESERARRERTARRGRIESGFKGAMI